MPIFDEYQGNVISWLSGSRVILLFGNHGNAFVSSMIVSLLLLGLACTSANAFYTLRQLSYTKLPASTRGDFKLFSGTAQEGAYDYKQSILYVVGM